MKLILLPAALLLCTSSATAAALATVTFFSDGALLEREATASKGVVEIQLPARLAPGSLRVLPLEGTVIQQVDILPARPDRRREKELEGLREQKGKLEDRLRALDTREAVFKGAAKSQSGKTPRKSKANPDPVQAMRQGTDFALAQLEAVYTARRRAEQELRKIEARLSAIPASAQGAGSTARVQLTPRSGKVRISYAINEAGWTPGYDIRLDGGKTARLTLLAQVRSPFDGALLKVSRSALADSPTLPAVPVSGSAPARLAEYLLPSTNEQITAGAVVQFTVTLENRSGDNLPVGEASVFRGGAYIGKARFDGISSGRSRTIFSTR